jgi:hypothetical protein
MPVFWVRREYPNGGHKRVGERGCNKDNYLILYPLILSFSLMEKGRSVCMVVADIYWTAVAQTR